MGCNVTIRITKDTSSVIAQGLDIHAWLADRGLKPTSYWGKETDTHILKTYVFDRTSDAMLLFKLTWGGK